MFVGSVLGILNVSFKYLNVSFPTCLYTPNTYTHTPNCPCQVTQYTSLFIFYSFNKRCPANPGSRLLPRCV